MWNIWTTLLGEWIALCTQHRAVHFITPPQAPRGISLWLSCVLDLVVPTVNFIPSKGLYRRKFHTFLTEINSESCELPYHKAFQWLSSGIVLSRFFAVWEQILKWSQLTVDKITNTECRWNPVSLHTLQNISLTSTLVCKANLDFYVISMQIWRLQEKKKTFGNWKYEWLLFIFGFLRAWKQNTNHRFLITLLKFSLRFKFTVPRLVSVKSMYLVRE